MSTEPVSDLHVSLEGFEGPLELLLDLARAHKIDLKKISLLALVDQYVSYLREVLEAKLAVAAEYLVMAAWLTYLKSQFLLPPPEREDPSVEELAEALAERLRKLEAVRSAVAWLQERPKLHEVRLPRGGDMTPPVRVEPRWTASLGQLLAAYGQAAHRTEPVTIELPKRPLVSVEAMVERLSRLLTGQDWRDLRAFLPEELGVPGFRRSAIAAGLVATLELARTGRIDLEQSVPFGPIMVRRRA